MNRRHCESNLVYVIKVKGVICIKYQNCQFKPADLHGVGGKQLSYDFAILDNVGNVTYVVECQGIQHFEPVVFFGGSDRFDIQIKHDVLKRQYANDILKTPMIEIDYNHKTKDAVFKKLNEFLNIVG